MLRLIIRFVTENGPAIAVLIAIAAIDLAVAAPQARLALGAELHKQACMLLTLTNMGLLEIWAGFGRVRTVVRLPAAMIGVWAWQWFICLGFGNSDDGRFMPASVCVYMVGTLTGLLLVLRAFDCRLVRIRCAQRIALVESSNSIADSKSGAPRLPRGVGSGQPGLDKPPQFSLLELFEAILALGVVLIVAKYCLWFSPGRLEAGDGASERKLFFVFWGSINLVPLCCGQSLAAIWIALGQRSLVLGLTLVTAMVGLTSLGSDSAAAWAALDAGALLGPLLVLRFCGYRLVIASQSLSAAASCT